MIRWFFKYGYVVFLLNTILYSINSTKDSIAPVIFLVIMFSTLFFLIINPRQIREVLFHKSFLFLLLLNLINFSYFLIFDDISNLKSFEYLMARAMQFSLISLSIYYNLEYFKKKFLDHLLFSIYWIVFLSLIFYPNIFAGRYSGIVWNPNMLSSFTGIGFAILLLKEEKKTRFQLFMMGLLLLISISTGSRGVLIGITLSFILKYGFSLRNIIYAIMGLTLLLFFSNINMMDTSLDRITSQSLFNDRADQFYNAIENIMEKPWVGYGLSEYSGDPNPEKRLEEFGTQIMTAHNGYLSLFIQLGFIFGFLTLLIIFKKSYAGLMFLRNETGYIRIYSFIVLYTLIASNFESLITGINEFQTILFWFSLSILSYSKFIKEYES